MSRTLSERSKVESALLTPDEPTAGTMPDGGHEAVTLRSESARAADRTPE